MYSRLDQADAWAIICPANWCGPTEDMIHDANLLNAFDDWTSKFQTFVEVKGQVQLGKYRAYGYEAPDHKLADAKLKWRELRMSSGHGPKNSSPKIQNDLNLNQDTTFNPKKSAIEAANRE